MTKKISLIIVASFVFISVFVGCGVVKILTPEQLRTDPHYEWIPLLPELIRIAWSPSNSYHNKDYDSSKPLNNCVDKSVAYHSALTDAGIESRCVEGYTKRGRHMWVEVYNSETKKVYVVDPASSLGHDGFQGLPSDSIYYEASNSKGFRTRDKVYKKGLTREKYDNRKWCDCWKFYYEWWKGLN
ncbi:MAG: hypothetical protein ABII97_01340 [Patescibacteria group bacterium]